MLTTARCLMGACFLVATASWAGPRPVAVVQGEVAKPHVVLGQVRHPECRKSSADTPKDMERRARVQLQAAASLGAYTASPDALANVECQHRTGVKPLYGCEEAVFCSADVIHWK